MASRDSSGSRWEKEAGSCLFGVRVGRPGGKHNKPKGLLQFSALIAARDKQTNTRTSALAGPLSWARVSLRFKSHLPSLGFFFFLSERAGAAPRLCSWFEKEAAAAAGEGGSHKLSIFQTMSMWAYGFRRI